ncbi:ABC-type ribose transport system, auxiliary component [Caldibacillus debilis GB1]|jgi:D-ribose pyranase|uniref:D-ribose pyranase n=1 Tax=Caldibacillus debilis GB1 TaxID=1339248 RepID=A0A420VFH1_9BACI|nr:ABC-type ribose transport system, auxiliary component [Caldibacillus debilis GB1]
MKKHGILNSEIAKVLADLGHTDTIVIADCGLPVPAGVKKIDLALELGKPSFLDEVQKFV